MPHESTDSRGGQRSAKAPRTVGVVILVAYLLFLLSSFFWTGGV